MFDCIFFALYNSFTWSNCGLGVHAFIRVLKILYFVCQKDEWHSELEIFFL